jgi:ribosome-associated protein
VSILDPTEYTRLAVEVADDNMASDIAMLDVREVCDFADYFVVMTAESTRQINTLVEVIEKALKDKGILLHHREGIGDSGWALLDFSCLIVHIFRPETRDYYQIEGAWKGARETVRIQ